MNFIRKAMFVGLALLSGCASEGFRGEMRVEYREGVAYMNFLEISRMYQGKNLPLRAVSCKGYNEKPDIVVDLGNKNFHELNLDGSVGRELTEQERNGIEKFFKLAKKGNRKIILD